MGLRDELEPMLIDIRTEAGRRYDRYLADIPDKNLHPDVYANDRRDYDATVDALLNRIREFYVLDMHSFEATVNALSTPAENKPGPLVSPPPPGTAFASIMAAESHMRPVLEMITTRQWDSDAATEFRTNFLEPFEKASDWQAAYIKELAIGAQAFRNMVETTRLGLKVVAEGCLGALRYHQVYPGNHGDWRQALSDFGTLLGAVALFIPASAVEIALGVAGLASGLASAANKPVKEPRLQVDNSEYPQMILRSTGYALDELTEMVLSLDESLAKGLNDDLDSPNAFASANLRLPPPGISASSYRKLDIVDGDGKPPNQVVVSVVQLGTAGYHNLPDASYEYTTALAKLETAYVPGEMAKYFHRAVAPYNAAVTHLVDVLTTTRDGLITAGFAMVSAARQYQTTDEEQAQILDQLDALVPHHSNAPYH